MTRFHSQFNRNDRHKPFIGISLPIMTALAKQPMSTAELSTALNIPINERQRLSTRLTSLRKDIMIDQGYFGPYRIVPERQVSGRPKGRNPDDWKWYLHFYGWVELEIRYLTEELDIKILTPHEEYQQHRRMGRKFRLQDLEALNMLHDIQEEEFTKEELEQYQRGLSERQRSKQEFKDYIQAQEAQESQEP